LGRAEIETFLSERTRRSDASNRQIAQARDALELYYEQFRGIALDPRPDSATLPTPSPTSPRPAKEQAVQTSRTNRPDHGRAVNLLKPYQTGKATVNIVNGSPVLHHGLHACAE
jgi:hypothetical protein